MAKENNAVCVTCGKSYQLCRKCDEKNGDIYSWHSSCDTIECFEVLMVISDYYYHKISKTEAKAKLSKLLTEDMKPYHAQAADLINEIMKSDEPKAPKSEKK